MSGNSFPKPQGIRPTGPLMTAALLEEQKRLEQNNGSSTEAGLFLLQHQIREAQLQQQQPQQGTPSISGITPWDAQVFLMQHRMRELQRELQLEQQQQSEAAANHPSAP